MPLNAVSRSPLLQNNVPPGLVYNSFGGINEHCF